MTPSEAIAKEMLARFPLIAPPFDYVNVTDGAEPFDVALDDCKLSLNKIATEAEMGRLDATVKLHSGKEFEGFQGGVYHRFMDDKGNVVFAMLGHIKGVNGRSVPGQDNRITVIDPQFVPLDVLSAIYAFETKPIRAEGPALDNLKRTIDELAKGAEAIADGVKKIGASVAEIAAAIKAFG